ncbi:MAG: hypothetical protein JNM43_28010 [Planctomycetaceae bacterium]|nr:hypothetical protein [Planctomycetaceae bacterium]
MVTLRSVFESFRNHVLGYGRTRRARRQCSVVAADALELRIVPATVVWTGGSLVNDNWSNPKNWEGETIPVPGDDVEFGPNVGRFDRTPINDLSGLKLNKLRITSGGYTLKGNSIQLSDGVSSVSEDRAGNNVASLASVIQQNITIPDNHDLSIFVGQRSILHIAGRISGPAASSVRIDGDPSATLETRPKLFFTGNQNNLFGKTIVRGLDVGLSRTAGTVTIPGDLTLDQNSALPGGAVFLNQSEQIRDTAHVDIVGDSRIVFGADISETVNDVLFSRAEIGGTRIQGQGNLTVNSTIVSTPVIPVEDSLVKSITIDIKSLNRRGPGTLTFDVPAQRRLTVSAAVKGNTGIRKTGAGELNFAGTTSNTYSGTTLVDAGLMSFSKPSGITALPGTLEIGNASAPQTAVGDEPPVKVSLAGNEIVSNTAVIIVHPNGLLEAPALAGAPQDEVFGELILDGGRVNTFRKLSPKRVTVQSSALGSTVFGELHVPASVFGVNTIVDYNVADGVAINDANVARVTGDGSWSKRGPGTMLSKVDDNTAVQNVTVTEGILELKGFRQSTTVTVQDLGTLRGDAIIGGLNVKSSGRVDSSQLLTVFGNVEFKPFTVHQLRPTATTTTQMKLATTGNVILGDAGSQAFPVLDLLPQGTIPVGTRLTVLSVPANKTLTGKYATPTPTNTGGTVLNEGTTFTAGGQNFTISYQGGTSGKDVVVTRNTGPAFVNRALPQTANEGEQVTLRGHITEPDSGDSFRLTVSWGDGQQQTFDFPAGSDPNVILNHQYEQDGNYRVHLDWRDQHGGGNTGDHQIRIRNQRPVLQDVSLSSPIVGTRTTTLFGKVTDAGSLDTLKVTVHWGDGSRAKTVTVGPAGEVQSSHTFRRPGRYRITISAFDGQSVTTTRLWLTVG